MPTGSVNPGVPLFKIIVNTYRGVGVFTCKGAGVGTSALRGILGSVGLDQRVMIGQSVANEQLTQLYFTRMAQSSPSAKKSRSSDRPQRIAQCRLLHTTVRKKAPRLLWNAPCPSPVASTASATLLLNRARQPASRRRVQPVDRAPAVRGLPDSRRRRRLFDIIRAG